MAHDAGAPVERRGRAGDPPRRRRDPPHPPAGGAGLLLRLRDLRSSRSSGRSQGRLPQSLKKNFALSRKFSLSEKTKVHIFAPRRAWRSSCPRAYLQSDRAGNTAASDTALRRGTQDKGRDDAYWFRVQSE